MGDELGGATDIDRLLVSSGLSTPELDLIENNEFWSCHTDFFAKMSQNFVLLGFLGYLGEVESGSLNVWTCILSYPIVPGSVLPIFKS